MSVADVLAGRRAWCAVQADVLGRAPDLASLRDLPEKSVHCVVTSIPYWNLRSYLADDHPLKPYEIGCERTPEEYVEKIVACFREVRRVLRDDGTLWVNVGDTYYSNPSWGRGRGTLDGRQHQEMPKHPTGRRGKHARIKPKDLVGIPWMVAFALRDDGWYLRRDNVWWKPNAMPENVDDRFASCHEYVFQFSKRARYFFDQEACKEPAVSTAPSGNGFKRPESIGHNGQGSLANPDRWLPTEKRNRRSVWAINTVPYAGAHFATFPPEVPSIPIRAGTSERGVCPACGAPWKRVVRRARTLDGAPSDVLPAMRNTDRHRPSSAQGVGHWRIVTVAETIGWAPTCKCDAGEPVPAIVLDPFGGSGRTVVAALRLGRRAIATDLDPDAVRQTEEQVVADAPLFNSQPREEEVPT